MYYKEKPIPGCHLPAIQSKEFKSNGKIKLLIFLSLHFLSLKGL